MPDEFTRIAAIAARVPAGGAGVALGIGDDAAVLAPLAGRVVLTSCVHGRRCASSVAVP
jgi:thiamine monophosphate kinase